MRALASAQKELAGRLASALEPMIERDGGDPRSRYLLALARYQRSEDEEAVRWIREAVAACDRACTHNELMVGASRVCSESARLAAALRNGELLEDASDAFDRIARSTEPDLEILGSETTNPHLLAAAHALDRRKYGAMFRFLSRSFASETSAPELMEKLRKDLSAEAFASAVLRELGSPAGPQEYLDLATAVQRLYGSNGSASALLEGGPEFVRKDPVVLLRRMFLLAGLKKWGEAAAVADELRHPPGTPSFRSADAALFLAQAALLAGKKEDGKRALDEASKELAETRPSHLARVLLAYEEKAAALRAYEAALKKGEAPHFPLGALYLDAERYDDAMRMFNRDIASGTKVKPWPSGEEFPLPSPPFLPSGSPEGRARVLEKVGEMHFIERLVQATPPCSEETWGRVKGLIAKWNPEDEEACRGVVRELEAMGPATAPALAGVFVYLHDPPELRTLLYETLSRWAEPR